MCECGKGHTVPDPSPWSVMMAGLLLLSGKLDGKGGFKERVDPKIVRDNARFLRNFAESRASSASVVRIRNHRDDEKVRDAACELICWLDAIEAAYAPLAGR